MRFVDTNILLYSISADDAESEKAETATDILDQADLALSVQVLQEFFVQTTHPRRPDRLSGEDALALVETWFRYPVQETTVALMKAAATASERWRISYWDAAVIEAARALGCTQVLTEDLNDGRDYAGVVAVNPFSRSNG